MANASDRLKSPPQNAAVGALAKALRYAKTALNLGDNEAGGAGDLVMGQFPEYVEDASYGMGGGGQYGSIPIPDQRLLDSPVTPSISKAKMAAAALPALAGSITRGGNKNIFLTHTSRIEPLIEALRQGGARLEDPAIAASKSRRPFGDVGVKLYPHPSKIDPANNPRSHMYGTDIYSYRYGSIIGRNPLTNDYRLTEGYYPNSASQLATVLASPSFKSLAEYETSPAGAKRLVQPNYHFSMDETADLEKQLRSYILDQHPEIIDWEDYAKQGLTPSNFDFVRDPRFSIVQPKGTEVLLEYLRTNPRIATKANRTKQRYAEMKYTDFLPIDNEHIGAVGIMNNPHDLKPYEMEQQHELMDLLADLDIPFIGEYGKPPQSSEIDRFLKFTGD